MNKVTTVGIDLAKSVFYLHGVDEHGKIIFRKRFARSKVMPFLAHLSPCLIGMEACSGAHHWGREIQKLGHEVRLMNPKFVQAYVKTNKSDSNDAEAVCEAVLRPNMRFVPIKSIEQQDIVEKTTAKQFNNSWLSRSSGLSVFFTQEGGMNLPTNAKGVFP